MHQINKDFTMSKLKKNKIIPLNIIMICLLIWFVILSCPAFFSGFFSMVWPKTTGVILDKSLNEKSVRGSTRYQPLVKYTYSVKKKKYCNDKISFSLFIFDKQWATGIINKYNSKEKINVYYNPFNHQISCLKPGLKISAAFYFLLGLGGLGYYMVYYYKKIKMPEKILRRKKSLKKAFYRVNL